MGVGRDIDDLPKNDANHTALTPLWFLERAALVHPTRTSVVHGSRHYTWHQTYQRCRRFASALSNRSIGLGHTAIIQLIGCIRFSLFTYHGYMWRLLHPTFQHFHEAHFGIPMAGAVLNTINVRLNASAIAFLLVHSSAVAVIVDQEFFPVAEESLEIWSEKSRSFNPPIVVVIGAENCHPKNLIHALAKGAVEYEKFLESGDPEFKWKPPQDEWQSIALGYTSGTTSSPKGVVLHHRGAYLMSLSGALHWGMSEGAVYLWTLSMFHCNGCSSSICNRRNYYDPSTICAWKPEWESLPVEEQGVRYIALEGLEVMNTETMQAVPADGTTVGEIVMRGNAVMKGYLKNRKANEEAFANGWFHSGDLAVKHPDGFVEIKDRSKDIIISGGENISSGKA
ncbi:Acetate/butyrate--CoA ligase AAE7, peroxisomal [Glycine soja]|nr:Acetate/butyrate--CoA ligase AAE7, peroxisomal [Glycine soja]